MAPDENSNGRLVTLSLPRMQFNKVLKYDVCCQQGDYYVCRTVSKNLGIEAYLTKDKKAIIHVNHPDMIGARCTLMWVERRD